MSVHIYVLRMCEFSRLSGNYVGVRAVAVVGGAVLPENRVSGNAYDGIEGRDKFACSLFALMRFGSAQWIPQHVFTSIRLFIKYASQPPAQR